MVEAAGKILASFPVMGSGAHLYCFSEAGHKKVLLECEKLQLEQ
jgi:hypothetical protein